jgi:hypothetical protein
MVTYCYYFFYTICACDHKLLLSILYVCMHLIADCCYYSWLCVHALSILMRASTFHFYILYFLIFKSHAWPCALWFLVFHLNKSQHTGVGRWQWSTRRRWGPLLRRGLASWPHHTGAGTTIHSVMSSIQIACCTRNAITFILDAWVCSLFRYVACNDQLRDYVVAGGHHPVTSETSC